MKNPSTISSGESDERAAFENHLTETFGYFDFSRNDDGSYCLMRVKNDWELWCAALAAQPAEFEGRAYDFTVSRGYDISMTPSVQAGTESKACASVAKPLDDPRLQQAFGDAIEGALAFGFQGSNEPPAGHWLWRFWNIGHAEATKVPSADLLRAAQVALHEMCKVGCPGVDDLDEAITDAKAAALASPAPSVGEPVAQWQTSASGEGGWMNIDADEVEFCRDKRGYKVRALVLATPPAAPATGDFEKLVAETWNDPGMAEARAWAKDTLTQTPAATEAPSEVEQLRRALVYVAMGLHGAQQHMLIKGITLMDGDRVAVKVADVNVDTGRVDVRAMFDAGHEENASAFATPAPAVGASPQTVFDGERDAQTLLRKYKKLCMEIKRGDGYHLARIDAAIAALAAVGASVQPVLASLSDTQRLDALRDNSWDLRCLDIPTGQGDADIHWSVIEHHEGKPHEREVGCSYSDDPRAAIDDALASSTPTKGGEAS